MTDTTDAVADAGDAREPRVSVRVSVLVTVYAGVAAEHLAAAMDSVAAQTLRERETVVVVDGPVSADHERVLAGHPDAVVVRLLENRGSGLALAEGMRHCAAEWVARVDADDVSHPTRLADQLRHLDRGGADVCATALAEFAGSPDQVVGVRRTPLDHDEFARLMPRRNPVNQPSVVFRRSLAERARGYQHLPFHEDYDLWARMLCAGAVFTGLAEPLVSFRVNGMHERRTRPEALAAERELQRRFVRYGLTTAAQARMNLALRTAYLRLPPRVLGPVYRALFRERSAPSRH